MAEPVALVEVVAHQVLDQVEQEILQVHLQVRDLLVEVEVVDQKEEAVAVAQVQPVLVVLLD
tara:strand:- start:352 stop:537 length:186 start_codon:yes stop_codon:yes gene_type:complete